MKPYPISRWIPLLAVTTLTLTAHSLQADFSTGFETASGSYTSGATTIGVHDTGLSGSTAWSLLFGSNANSTITSTPADVQSGSQALHIVDSDTASAQGLSLNLANTANFSTPFTLHFGLNLLSYGGSGSPVQFNLGANTTLNSSAEYWTNGFISSGGVIYLNVASSVGGLSTTSINLGNYTTYSALGQYISFDITIDPTTHKYTSVIITGANSGAVDKTSTILASLSGGEIPWINGGGTNTAPSSYFVLAAGTNTTATFDIDNLSIANVPEPASLSLVLLGSGLVLASRRRR